MGGRWSLDSLPFFRLLVHYEDHWTRESFTVVVLLGHLRSLAFCTESIISFYLLLLLKLEALKIFLPVCWWPFYCIGKAFLETDNVICVVLIYQVLSLALTQYLFISPIDSLKSLWGNTLFFLSYPFMYFHTFEDWCTMKLLWLG